MPDHRDIGCLHRIVVAPQRFRPKKDRRHSHQTDALKKQSDIATNTQRPDGCWQRSEWCCTKIGAGNLFRKTTCRKCQQGPTAEHTRVISAALRGSASSMSAESSTASLAQREKNAAPERKPSNVPRDFGTWRGNAKGRV